MTPIHSNSRSPRVATSILTRWAAALALVAAACSTEQAAAPLAPTSPTGRVRFVTLITDTTRGRVNAILENVPFGVNLTYGTSTPITLPSPATAIYSPIYTGARSLVLKRTIDTSNVATINFTVAAGLDYTIFAQGGAGASAITSTITTDTNTAPAAGQARVRLLNMSPTAGALDIFVTAVGADLTVATPSAANVAVGASGGYLALAAGTYQVRAVPAGTAPASRPGAVTVNLASVAIPALAARTFVAADNNVGGAPLRWVTLTDR